MERAHRTGKSGPKPKPAQTSLRIVPETSVSCDTHALSPRDRELLITKTAEVWSSIIGVEIDEVQVCEMSAASLLAQARILGDLSCRKKVHEIVDDAFMFIQREHS